MSYRKTVLHNILPHPLAHPVFMHPLKQSSLGFEGDDANDPVTSYSFLALSPIQGLCVNSLPLQREASLPWTAGLV